MTPDNSWLSLVLSWAGTYLVHSTLLVGTVWVFLRVCSRASQPLREFLWKTALVGGVATSLAQGMLLSGDQSLIQVQLRTESQGAVEARSASRTVAELGSAEPEFSVHRLVRMAPADDSLIRVPEFGVVTEGGDEWAAGPVVLKFTNAIEPSILRDSEADRPGGDAATRLETVEESHSGGSWLSTRAGTVCLATLLLAGLWGISRAIWQSCVLRRRLAECVPVQGGVAYELLEELRASVPGCPPVDLLASADESEPAALGVWRWRIILPERAERELSRAELRSLLAHELAHLVRGDSVWLLISRMVCSGLAFQPLNQLARREWQKSAEFQCDAWAVSRTGTPLALARCLTEVASWRLSRRVCAPTLAATGRRSGLGARIERLLQSRSAASESDWGYRGRFHPAWSLLLLVPLTLLAPRLRVEAGLTPGQNENLVLNENLGAMQSPEVESDPALLVGGDLQSRLAVFEPGTEVTRLFLEVEHELMQLDRELIELAPLLSRSEVSPEVHQVVRLIHLQTSQLRGRRWMLLRQFSVADGVAVPMPGAGQTSL